MEKRGVLFLLVLISLTSLFNFCLVSADGSVSVKNYSIQKTYSPGDVLSGWLNLTIEGINSNSNFSTNLGESANLREVLDNGSLSYFCDIKDCSDKYEYSDEEESKTLNIISEALFGFVLNGKQISVESLSFDVSSNFGKSYSVPLELNLFNYTSWKYKESSNDYSRSESWGFFSRADSQAVYNIGETRFCEKVLIPETNSVKIGALISGTDTKELKMILYDDFEREKARCTFKPFNGEDSCIVNVSDFSEERNYFVCVKADSTTKYKIYSETIGNNSGWFGSLSGESTIDYGLFAKTPKFAEAKQKTIDKNTVQALAENANYYLAKKYSNTCDSGCVLPVLVKGMPQELKISNISLTYLTSHGPLTTNKIYELNAIPSKINFSGILYLNQTGFNVSSKGNKTLELFLNNEKLFSEKIQVLPAPVIKSIYPINPPAGVLTDFIAEVDSENNISSYLWDFGDGTRETTSESNVKHIYTNISSYTLTLSVTDNKGFSSSKSFSIISGSPQEVVELIIEKKQKQLNDTINSIANLSFWFKNELKNLLRFDNYSLSLEELKKQKDKAVSQSEFLELALALHELKIPESIFVSKRRTGPLLTYLQDISPLAVQTASGEKINISSEEEYKNAILQWQFENINGTIGSEEISVKINEEKEVILNSYNVSLSTDYDGEMYFAVGKPSSELGFREKDSMKSVDELTIISFKGDKKIDFYSKDEIKIFFVSPKLSSLGVISDIGKCNFNKLCEKDQGEDYNNCRSDCKPWGKALLYIGLVLIFVLLLYTLLQIWYKTRYEKSLFKDRNYLFNLVMFINNAFNKRMVESEIKGELKNKGWSGEQIAYVLKKAKGQRTGMFEIIPIERALAYFRKRKLKKITTKNAEQFRQNINKGFMQGINNAPRNPYGFPEFRGV